MASLVVKWIRLSEKRQAVKTHGVQNYLGSATM